jgi:serine/threonine-protein kinase RsbW
MRDDGELFITLPAEPENVAVMRQRVAAGAKRLGVGKSTVADLRIVVSEACTNVVLHAYEDETTGPLEVELVPEGRELSVVVRDVGAGIRPQPEAGVEKPRLRMGLPVIGALSNSFHLSSVRNRGTEIRIHLPLI